MRDTGTWPHLCDPALRLMRVSWGVCCVCFSERDSSYGGMQMHLTINVPFIKDGYHKVKQIFLQSCSFPLLPLPIAYLVSLVCWSNIVTVLVWRTFWIITHDHNGTLGKERKNNRFILYLHWRMHCGLAEVICNYLHSNAGNNSGMKICTACSTFSSLLIVLTHNTKKRLHYTLNTLHQTLHYRLTIHSKRMSKLSKLSITVSHTITAAVTLPPKQTWSGLI